MSKLNLGLIGLGHWGPNLFRNFFEHPQVELKMICDQSAEKQAKFVEYNVPFTQNWQDLLAPETGLDAVVIATPLCTHYELVKASLEAGKHVFVEKPIAETAARSYELTALAQEKGLFFMVGHVFMYNGGIRFVKEHIESGDLGEILFIHGQRTNLGPVRKDANALWDLAAHDISIYNYWLKARPTHTSAVGSCILSDTVEDVVNASFSYENNIKCSILCSWLHPCKVRQITVVGSKKMLVWDDMDNHEPVRIYDKSITPDEPAEQIKGTLSEFRFSILDGEITVPRIPGSEPLRAECNHFVESILNGSTPLSDGVNGSEVVAALEAASASIRNDSTLTPIQYR
ncbi:MAG: Gfo/Idh/MocA family protein [Planctomycetota bacterium]|jgi:predicted dehydrogenase